MRSFSPIKLLLISALLIAACKKADHHPTGIHITNHSFSPVSITVPRGSVVTWTNLDYETHTITGENGSFDSGDIPRKKNFSRRFPEGGIFHYRCRYHGAMKGKIIVQ